MFMFTANAQQFVCAMYYFYVQFFFVNLHCIAHWCNILPGKKKPKPFSWVSDIYQMLSYTLCLTDVLLWMTCHDSRESLSARTNLLTLFDRHLSTWSVRQRFQYVNKPRVAVLHQKTKSNLSTNSSHIWLVCSGCRVNIDSWWAHCLVVTAASRVQQRRDQMFQHRCWFVAPFITTTTTIYRDILPQKWTYLYRCILNIRKSGSSPVHKMYWALRPNDWWSWGIFF